MAKNKRSGEDRPRIVFLDLDPNIRQVITAIQAKGYTVSPVIEVGDAIRLAQAESVVLVIHLANKNEFSKLDLIMAALVNKPTKVIVTLDQGNYKELRDRCLRAGAAEVLRKPYDAKGLLMLFAGIATAPPHKPKVIHCG